MVTVHVSELTYYFTSLSVICFKSDEKFMDHFMTKKKRENTKNIYTYNFFIMYMYKCSSFLYHLIEIFIWDVLFWLDEFLYTYTHKYVAQLSNRFFHFIFTKVIKFLIEWLDYLTVS